MKKATVLVLLSLFIAPSIASAAWWNPFAWKKTPEAVKEIATSTATTTFALPSTDDLYKRIAELEQKLDDARQSMKKVEASAKAEVKATPNTASTADVSDKEILVKVRPAVVFVETATTSGGALIIDSQGHVLTSASSVWTKDSDGYVIGASTDATITFSNGSKKKAVLVGIDESANLAILQLSDKKSSTYISPSYDSGSVLGDTLYIFGYSSEQSNTKGSFVSGIVAQKTSSSIQMTTEIKPLENGGFVVTKNRGLIAVLNSSNCKVLEEGSKCLKYNVTANPLSSVRIQKLIGGMKLYKNKQNRTPEETLFRGFFDGMYNTVNQSGAIDYAIDNATGRNSFDYFNNKLADDKDSKVTKIYLNKLKTTATNMYQAFDLLKSITYALHISFINEEGTILKLDPYQRKIAGQINADNEIRLKDYQAKVAVWAKKKSEYDSYILRPSDVTHDYLMAEGVSVENAADYLKKERQKLLDSFSGETVNVY